MEEDVQKTLVVPKKEIARMFVVHLGVILSNLSIFGLVVGASALFFTMFSMLISAFLIMLWIFLIVATIGFIFVMIPNYGAFLPKISSFMDMIPYESFIEIVKIALPFVIALSVGSILCLAFDKFQNHKGRIVFSSIVLGLLLAIFVILLLGVM
ncbi:MAG: hypothetical protein ACI4TI_00200 [Christensenellales bacterium]